MGPPDRRPAPSSTASDHPSERGWISCRSPCSPLWHSVGVMPRRPTIAAMRIALIACAVAAVLIAGGCGVAPTPLPSQAGTASWTTLAATAPTPLLEVAVAERAGRIWVAGGLRSDGSASDEVFVFDPAGGTWISGPTLPEAVHHASMVSTPQGLVLVGGYRR